MGDGHSHESEYPARMFMYVYKAETPSRSVCLLRVALEKLTNNLTSSNAPNKNARVLVLDSERRMLGKRYVHWRGLADVAPDSRLGHNLSVHDNKTVSLSDCTMTG